MDKLKSVLSHGSKKGAHGEGRHLHDSNVKPNPSTSAEAGEQHHPIYDQFAKTKTTAPTDMTTPAPQSQAAPSDVQGEPGIRPNAPYGVPPHHVDETSTASVKSGVMGLPQGKTYQEAGQTQSGALPPSRLHHQKGYDDLNSQATTTSRSGAAALGHGQPFDQSSPGVITDTNREFPLAGGVTYRHDAEARPNPAGTGSTSTEEVANEGKSQGGLAGAAAAITAVAATAATTARSAAASAFSTAQPRSDSQDQAARQHDQELAGEALAGAVAASKGAYTQEHAGDHSKSAVDPCVTDNKGPSSTMFTSGPHRTDTANRMDPSLHVPGEFPETPLETPGAGTGNTGGYIPPTSQPSELSSAQETRDTPATANFAPTGSQTDSTSHPTGQRESDHHKEYAAAGIGAAALGAYGANKHHQREKTDFEGDSAQSPSSPYSSTKLDPRVDSRPANFEGQRFDPAKPTKPSPHGLGASTHATQAAPASVPSQNIAQEKRTTIDDKPSNEHHTARNAGLAGAGAAAAGGLYYATHRDDQENTKQEPPAAAPQQMAGSGDQFRQQSLGENTYSQPQQHTGPARGNVAAIPHPSSKQQQHHHGVAGGAGLGGSSAAEVEKQYDEHINTHHLSSMEDQRYDPSAPGAHDPNQAAHHHGRNAGLAAAAGGLAYGASKTGGDASGQSANQQQSSAQAPQSSQTRAPLNNQTQRDGQQHTGRNAALGAAGVGAAGAGLYAASRQGDNSSRPTDMHPTSNQSVDQGSFSGQGAPQPETQQQYGRNAAQDQQSFPTQGAPQPEAQHHHGRDAALGAAGAGAVGTDVHAASRHPEDNRHQENVTGSSRQPTHQQVSPSHDRGVEQQPEAQHHYGRNAALGAAGAGAVGTGIYAASRRPEDNDHQNIAGSFNQPSHQQMPPSHDRGLGQQPHFGHDATSLGAAPRQPGGVSPTHVIPDMHNQSPYQQPHPQNGRHVEQPSHFGRDAAGVAGMGAAGAGIYAAARQPHDTSQSGSHMDPQNQATHQQSGSAAVPDQRQRDFEQEQHDQHHGRNAAIAGGAAGVAGAGAGYAYAQHQGREAEQERLAQEKMQQKELEHQRKAEQKELEHQRKAEQHELEKKQKAEKKAEEKELEHQKKEQEKKLHHEQKQHDKLVAAEEKARQKEIEKENARRQKQAEAEHEHEGKEKKHHLLGFLHKDKNKDKKHTPEQSPRTSKEYTGERPVDGGSPSQHEGRHKLHKDPPPGHPAWQAYEEQRRSMEADARHPVQTAGNDSLHSGVYQPPPGNNAQQGEGMDGYRQFTGM